MQKVCVDAFFAQLPFNLDSEFSVVNNVIALSSIHRDDVYRTYLLYYDE